VNIGSKLKVLFLLLGDAVALYAALLLALALRYGGNFYGQFVNVHFAPFSIVFIPWLIIFYVAGLYDLRRLRNNLDFLKTLALSLMTNAAIAIILFYLVPSFGIAPKTNLFIFIFIFAVIETWWRRLFNRATSSGEAPNRVLLVGNGLAAAEIETALKENPQLGYEITTHLSEEEASQSVNALEGMAKEHNVNLVVVPRELKRKGMLTRALYGLFGRGIVIIDLDNFYEIIMRKVPLADIEETWFLENIEGAAKFYDQLKRAFEFLFAVIVGIVLLPLELLIALIVKFTSRGPAIYKQARIGKNGRDFILYKFRTMRADAERNGAQWAAKNDARVTLFGKFLRASHLDELPQLLNVIRGNLSFVGPRPERPEFVAKLKTQIPFYEVRLLIKPGVTGWAQIHHRADLDVEDVKQKLQYDIYYLKNRSLILDLAIILKTLKSFFINPQ
jgi:exopolysaccharide biosynthesis polyprenyl glycosylphosphotransferase